MRCRKRWLLDYTIEIIEKYFWSRRADVPGILDDNSKTEEYRGGNANMHAVEAFLIVVYDVTRQKMAGSRSSAVASVIIHDVAKIIIIAVMNTSIPSGIRCRITTKITSTSTARSEVPGHWIE